MLKKVSGKHLILVEIIIGEPVHYTLYKHCLTRKSGDLNDIRHAKGKPNHPYSLMEGLAGQISFLSVLYNRNDTSISNCKKRDAPAGNRTRVESMATIHRTTRPPVRVPIVIINNLLIYVSILFKQ